MVRDLWKYVGGFVLCIVVHAVVSGLRSEHHHPESMLYALIMIVFYGAWGLYVFPLFAFHISAKYLETYDYGSYVVLSTLVWVLYGLLIDLLVGSSESTVSYLFIGLAYGFYYRIKLFDETDTQ